MTLHIGRLRNIIDRRESLALLQNCSKRARVNFRQIIAGTVLFNLILFRILVVNIRKFVTYGLQSSIDAPIVREYLVVE